MVTHLSTSMGAIADWFKQYQVESIELWINGMMNAVIVVFYVLTDTYYHHIFDQ
jgi:hypothetical protein